MKISVRVVPRVSKNEVVGVAADGFLRVRLTAAPVDGQANEALITLLSAYFKTKKSAITIVRGFTSKNKIVEVEN